MASKMIDKLRITPLLLVSALLFSTALLGCNKKAEPKGSQTELLPSPAPNASKPEAAPELKPPGAKPADTALPEVEVTWEEPNGWKLYPPRNRMRKANYVIPRVPPNSEDAEFVISYFGPNQGGSIEDNAQRWIKQFKDVPDGGVVRADRKVNGLDQHTIEIESGTYDARMPGAPPGAQKKEWSLLGAIVTAPSGKYFFKLTGPKKTVKAAKKEFYRLLDSVKSS